MQQILEGLEGVHNFIDDIIIWGATLEEHSARLWAVLEHLRKANMRLNLEKCLFCQTEIEYLGEKLSVAGVQPSAEKVKAVRDMPKPQNLEELRRVLVLVNYLGKFVPNISEATHELQHLARDGSE